ncbi:DUF4435 domain-containing protein [Vibrio cholerae]|uniref:DUF4435 domain-containing protein n=5 Tax=Vibrio cholerae TaxID=666 RepID=UPI00115C0330|nr:DUF4435 domain-containing protein [Vibrio cholerae]EJL6849083.1 DUF4435 domain-containing protein [Vibrio cholerae]ELH5152370.1 DUF4435 domain-containing protein [Vibrio cholerae]MBO1401642.1 hypothetical protein [Vibrio cholerae]TQP87487.1 DUF4435 domain-containing protein [Vibrio cholerae]GIA35403.1 hypothetical protein VCSRO85_3371 [Vibrio cholerae]
MPITDMQITFQTAVKNAFMNKKSLIVVEGKDDIGIYSDLLFDKMDFFSIKPIEYFKNCSSGCKEIEDQIDLINEIYPEGHKIYNFFKGIVDRDAKPFRGDCCNKRGVLYLNTYSFENSFVTENSIIATVKLLTSASAKELDQKLTKKVLDLINQQFIDFYYICLEALRNSVEDNYQGLIGFSQGYDRLLYDQNIKDQLELRKSGLDNFAAMHGISSSCILNMKSYCKGKWHLRYFLASVQKFISDLYEFCGTDLSKCPYCEIGERDKCLYKPSTTMNVEHIIKSIKSNISNADLNTLRAELLKMA